MPSKVYTAEEEAENIFGGYVFKHYALSPNSSSSINLASYPITAQTDFYSVFIKAEDLREYVQYDYFDFIETTYIDETNSAYNTPGYQATPKNGLILSGKITIPAEYNGKPVVSIGKFYNQQITHLFFEKGSKVLEVADFAFCKDSKLSETCTTLQYFEFIDSIKKIGIYAFASVGLRMTQIILPKDLNYLGAYAFRGAYTNGGTNDSITIIIGANLTIMSIRAISNLGDTIPSVGHYIMIGDENNSSKLLFENTLDTTDYRFIFDSYKQFTIDFYTTNYHSLDDVALYIGSKYYTVAECIGNKKATYNPGEYENIITFIS